MPSNENYMSQLNDWTREVVIKPLMGKQSVSEEVINTVLMAIRVKTLESYRNGQKAKPLPKIGISTWQKR